MKWIRLGALSAFLLSITATLVLFLMVKQVPRHENAWHQTRAEITPAKKSLLQCSHLCQRFLVVLFPACLGLMAISTAGYVLAVKIDNDRSKPAA